MNRRKKWSVGLFSADIAALTLLWMFFFIGSVAGCIAAGVMDPSGHSSFAEYVQGYIVLLSEGGIRPQFWPLVRDVLRFPLMVLLAGFTAIGVILMPVLFSVRGFLLCFAISAFYRWFGFAGQLPAFLLFGLSAVIWLPVLFHLGVQGILASYSMLRRAAGEGRYPLRYGYQYLTCCGLCIAALGVCAALEYLVVPVLLRAVVGTL